MSSQEAEELIEDQALKFEERKDYLIEVCNQKAAKKAAVQR